MDLLAAGYGSDSENDNEIAHEEVVPKPAAVIASRRQVPEDSDDDTAESSDKSIDSAELRAAEAAARLKDFGEVATSGRSSQQQLVQEGSRQQQQKQQAAKSLLPSALDVLDQVKSPGYGLAGHGCPGGTCLFIPVATKYTPDPAQAAAPHSPCPRPCMGSLTFGFPARGS
ncbi:hypothetical protein Vafri_3905 [Volvox africanus]|uniref:Uncharacterized protein n=1 Tax=Volvox africanus TaxID=51714 RepID=A0A8J4AWC4_9CHLO|nr:hypothetical protein Vafri_3905 [Volvox africanus]